MSRRAPLRDHPFSQDADLIDELLRLQRAADRAGTGQCITQGEDHERRLRAERDRLRYLARLDYDNGWPFEDAS